MGIRFTCPNGHQLNVKAIQAGKTGKCPRCGITVVIPQASESTDKSEPAEGDSPLFAGAKAGTVPGAQSTPASVPRDPFAEAPGAAWYIHLSGVERHGPISADVMRAWLAQGRVPGDALVWREGWTQWAVAAKVLPIGAADAATPRKATESFPPVQPGGAQSGAKGDSPIFAETKIGTVPEMKIGTNPGAIGAVSAQSPISNLRIEADRPARAVRPARRTQRSRSMLFVGVLTAIVLLLGLVLLWVLTQ